jgi:Uma2 family endonuclease
MTALLIPEEIAATPRELRRFTVAEYHKLIEQGIFAEDENFELLNGLLVKKMSRNPPHDSTLDVLEGLLLSRLPAHWFPRMQRGITLRTSEPEPDVAIVRGPRTRYRNSHPVPSDIALVIEVSDTSLDFDRNDKLRLYAVAGIAQYWIVNIPDRQIEVFHQSVGPSFSQRAVYSIEDSVPFVLFDEASGCISVADIFTTA